MYKLLDGTIPYPIRKSEGETAPDSSEEQKVYLATNFDIVYDPSQTFRPEEAEDTSANSRNTTGYSDEELYRLAADMKQTKPGFFPPEEPEQTHGNHTFLYVKY